MITTMPTPRLMKPFQGLLKALTKTTSPSQDVSNSEKSARFSRELRDLVSQRHYPCVAAVKSVHKDDYQVGFYGNFGTGESWRDLRNDLLYFLAEQRKTQSIYLSFFAVFDGPVMSEEVFEKAMWHELSCLTSVEDRENDWKKNSPSDPDDKGFRFSLDGAEFFVVGLHPNSSRLARKFSQPVLIFNIFEQFEALMKLGQYDPMVKTNRERDQKFQGTVNPMVEAHGETWESIQFSGRNNPQTWKCPFHFFMRSQKP